MEIGFILFIAWTFVVYKLAYKSGKLNGGRDGARALARYVKHYNVRDPELIVVSARGTHIDERPR